MKKNSSFSPKYQKYLKNKKVDKITTILYQILLLVIVGVIWEIFTQVGILDKFFLLASNNND